MCCASRQMIAMGHMPCEHLELHDRPLCDLPQCAMSVTVLACCPMLLHVTSHQGQASLYSGRVRVCRYAVFSLWIIAVWRDGVAGEVAGTIYNDMMSCRVSGIQNLRHEARKCCNGDSSGSGDSISMLYSVCHDGAMQHTRMPWSCRWCAASCRALGTAP